MALKTNTLHKCAPPYGDIDDGNMATFQVFREGQAIAGSSKQYYFIKKADAKRACLDSNFIARKDDGILQYHTLGLPFFARMQNANENLKIPESKLNQIISDLQLGVTTNDLNRALLYGSSGNELFHKCNSLIVESVSSWEHKDSIDLRDYGYSSTLNPALKPKHEEFIKKQLWMTDGVKKAMGTTNVRKYFHFHPTKFVGYVMDELKGINVERLKEVQDEVLKLRCLIQGAKGIYPEVYDVTKGKKPQSPDQTYCNHAVYITIKAVDGNYKNFINYPSVYEYDDPPYSRSNEYEYKQSSYWCDFLEEQAGRGIIKELTTQDDALKYANMGYVVVVSWKNPNKRNEAHNAPHFATVRPGVEKDARYAIYVANVGGGTNGVKTLKDGFGEGKIDQLKFYYNPNQSFQFKLDEIAKYMDYK